MSKAIVIKNVDFLSNSLTTIMFSSDTPCTDISLNKNTVSFTAIGDTDTLIPTLTPVNTTDAVSWTSSNTNAVTVNNGLITAVGIGSATITVSCGGQTATCDVTSVNTLVWQYRIGKYNHGMQYEVAGRDYVYQEGNSVSYCAIHSEIPTTKRIWAEDQSTAGNKYPILLGRGASRVDITAPSTIRVTAWFTNSEEPCDYGQQSSGSLVFAKELGGDRNAYDANAPLGNRTITTIPAGADSISLSLQYPNGTITDEIVAQVSIVVS